jgi:outer membrane protein TolC
MIKRILVFSLLGLYVIPVFLKAESIPITLDEAMTKAAKQNLTMQQLDHRSKSLSLDTDIKHAGFFPTLQANGTYSYISKQTTISLTSFPPYSLEPKDSYDLNLTLSQVLFAGFRVRETYLLTVNRSNELDWQKESVRNQLRLGVGSIYFQVQSNRLLKKALEQSRARINNQMLYVRSLLEQKQAIPYDTLDVANRLYSLDTQISKLKQTEDVLNLKFNNFIHDENTEYTPANWDLSAMDNELQSLDSYIAMAKEKNADLLQIAMMKKSQTNLLHIQQSQLYPQLFASASYHEANPGTDLIGDKWMNYYTLGVGFQWNLWNWKANYRNVEQMRIEEKRLDLQHKQAWLNLEEQVKETYKNIEISKEQITMQERLFNQEQERYRILQDRYRENQVSSLDLSSGEKALTEAQLNLEQQYVSFYLYKLQMDALTGRLNSGRE